MLVAVEVGIRELRARLSHWIDRVQSGDEVIVTEVDDLWRASRRVASALELGDAELVLASWDGELRRAAVSP